MSVAFITLPNDTTTIYLDQPAPAFNFFAEEEWDENDVWSYETSDEDEDWDRIEDTWAS